MQTRSRTVRVARFLTTPVVAFAMAGVLPRAATAQKQSAKEPDLTAVRTALKKYEDPYLAVHDGYFSTLGCVVIEQPGAKGHVAYKPGGMGIHFFNGALMGPNPDPAKPQVLIYEPDGDKLKLIAAEWFVPLATGVKSRPQLWGRPFDGPMMGHPPLIPHEMSHYDLHVWLYKPNKLGTFEPTNPDVKCTGHPYRLVEEAPALVPEPKS
jgi:hypothetical protein